jgi:predicted small lipoprotein YifL
VAIGSPFCGFPQAILAWRGFSGAGPGLVRRAGYLHHATPRRWDSRPHGQRRIRRLNPRGDARPAPGALCPRSFIYRRQAAVPRTTVVLQFRELLMAQTTVESGGVSWRLVPVIAAMLGIAGCGGKTPTSPPPSSVISPVGSWLGSISDPISGDGAMQLTLSEVSPPSQTGTSLTGTWSATFKNGDGFSGSAVAGLYVPNGYGITLYVQIPLPPCLTEPGAGSAPLGFTLIEVVVTSSQLTAVSGRTSCNGPAGSTGAQLSLFGMVHLSKQ